VIAGCLHRVAAAWPRPLTAAELFGRAGAAGIAAQALLICLLKSVWVREPGLEHFLARLRALMLEFACGRADVQGRELALYSALAQQCFINEYVYALGDDEIREAVKWLLLRMKILVEPSGAATAAAALSGKLPKGLSRVGIVLSGGNVDFEILAGF